MTKLSALVAQFPISLDVSQNLATMLNMLPQARPDDLVLFPEGALSGYSQDSSFLEAIDLTLLDRSLNQLQQSAQQAKIHLIFGCCIFEDGRWFNAAVYYGPNGEKFIYRKINLAHSERGYFAAGSDLPVLEITLPAGKAKLGIQLCREIRCPDQWRYLARAGAELFVYLTNAVDNAWMVPVWHSHLVSRAAENQRFVLGTNNAHPVQSCPSIGIDPMGKVLWEMVSAEASMIRCTVDLAQVSNWYLDQARTDLLPPQPPITSQR